MNFNFFLNFNLNWIDWSGNDNLIVHSNIFSLLILYRFSWSQHPLFSKRFLVYLGKSNGASEVGYDMMIIKVNFVVLRIDIV